jgi:hypothetical protein
VDVSGVEKREILADDLELKNANTERIPKI